MATFVTHGFIGAAGTALILTHEPFEQSISFIAIGWILGAMPDTDDWLAAKLLGAKRWELYTRMHSGDKAWLAFLFPPMLWHILLDIFFHKNPGENWWPRLWWLGVGAFLASLATLYLVLK